MNVISQEQISIQHHFFGFDESGPFRAHLDALLKAHAAEASRTETHAYETCEALLAPHAPAGLAKPPRRLTLGELWNAS